jgi:hypothetical protein
MESRRVGDNSVKGEWKNEGQKEEAQLSQLMCLCFVIGKIFSFRFIITRWRKMV